LVRFANSRVSAYALELQNRITSNAKRRLARSHSMAWVSF
jgi:hypothetical protein